MRVAEGSGTALLSRLLLITFLALCLTSCGGVPQRAAVPRPPPGNLDNVPDAVPRAEPLSRYGNPPSYEVFGQRYHTLRSARGYMERGIASWYGDPFHGRRTSSGETYDMYQMTAAHKTLPLPSYVEVINLENGKRIVVRVNDRGPFHDNRVIDLSYVAARKLGVWTKGTGLVEVRAIDPGTPAQPMTPPTITVRVGAVELFLQAGAFGVLANAERLQQRLVAIVPDAPVRVTQATTDGQLVYRVRLGPLADVNNADALASLLEARGFELPHVVIE